MRRSRGVMVVLVVAAVGVLAWNAPAGAGCSIGSLSSETRDPSVFGSLQIDVSSMRARNAEIVVTRVPEEEVPVVTATIRGSVASRAECSSRVAPALGVALAPRGTSASVTVGSGTLPVEITKDGRVMGRMGIDALPGATLRLRW